MSSGHKKTCPRCGSVAALDAALCQKCGRKYRTKFSSETGTVLGRQGPYGDSGKDYKGKKLAPANSLLPASFHRPSDEHPEFAAPEGVPPTYHDLPSIDILRRDLGESLSRFGTPNADPISQLFLADAPGSPLTFEPPELPNLLPFVSTAGPQFRSSGVAADGLADQRFDWRNPGSFLGVIAGATDPGSSVATEPGASVATVSPISYGRPAPSFALAVSPVTAAGVEVEIDEQNYISINDLLPYDKAIKPVSRWARYSLNAVLCVCIVSIVFGTFDYMHMKPLSAVWQTMVALSPPKMSQDIAAPSEQQSGVVVDQDGDFLKPVIETKPKPIKGLNPSVFTQLSSGNSTVGVLDAAPDNVAVLPLNGEPDEDTTAKPQAFTQTPFPIVTIRLHHWHLKVR